MLQEIPRPKFLKDFIGKNNIINNLTVYINSAKNRQSPIDHCLFYGLPGTGKTTLAGIIANELNHNIKIVQGSTLQRPIDIINVVMSLQQLDVLFIDELHAINPQCIELLYSIMEDYAVDIALGKDLNARVTRIDVPEFTLVGATTSLGKIPKPLEERFGIIINLSAYTDKEIKNIIASACKYVKLKLPKKQMALLVPCAKGIPRLAIRLVKRVRDFLEKDKTITIGSILKKLNIHPSGLDELDIKYLSTLSKSKITMGVKSLSQTLGIDQQTIENKIEPFLLQKQLIIKTSSGRKISHLGCAILTKTKQASYLLS